MQSVDPTVIEAEIDLIRSLGLDALRTRWRMTFGSMPPPALTKDLIARMIAYRLSAPIAAFSSRQCRSARPAESA
jgi:hypothetical protein